LILYWIFFFELSTGVWIQDLMLTRQVPYHQPNFFFFLQVVRGKITFSNQKKRKKKEKQRHSLTFLQITLIFDLTEDHRVALPASPFNLLQYHTLCSLWKTSYTPEKMKMKKENKITTVKIVWPVDTWRISGTSFWDLLLKKLRLKEVKSTCFRWSRKLMTEVKLECWAFLLRKCLFFSGTWDRTQASLHARTALYQMNYISRSWECLSCYNTNIYSVHHWIQVTGIAIYLPGPEKQKY
jgi:hypothetical protein